MVQVFLLIFSLSIDSLMAGFSLGMNRIRVPIQYLFLLNGIGACLLLLSIWFGTYFERTILPHSAQFLSMVLFLILGICKILESIYHKLTSQEKEVKIRMHQVEFIFHIYANPEASDMDLSKHISCKEAICLGLALSLDNLAIGIGIGLLDVSGILVTLLSFVIGVILIETGHLFGMRIGKKHKFESAWISGMILIILAFLK